MLVQTINIHKFLLIDEKSPRPFELASGIHIQLPPRLIEVGYSLKELLCVLVEVVDVVFGVGVEVVLRAEVPVASAPSEGPVNHGSQSAAVKNVEDGEKSPERVDVVRF